MKSLRNIIGSKDNENEELINKLVSLQEKFLIQLDALKRENDGLRSQLNEFRKNNEELESQLKKNNEILDSYNEHFKLLFYYYDLKPKSLLKNIQDICQEVLDFVVNVCNKHSIEYWLDYGALLGAVRHDGFLPWDDDIDLGMMRKDYELFLEVFDSELKNHGLENQIKCRLLRHGDNVLYFIQISYAGFAVLDIFPYDYIENPPENIEELYDIEKSKFKNNILNDKSYSEALAESYSNLNLSRGEKSFVIPGVERPASTRFHVQESDELFPLTEVTFNGRKYLGHKNNDYHLQKLYGDWQDLPKVLERHNRIYKLKYRPNINDNLEKKVNALHKVNDNFND